MNLNIYTLFPERKKSYKLTACTSTVNNFVGCGFETPYYKTHTLRQIHILPQNSFLWALCKPANIGTALGNSGEIYLQEDPVQLPSRQ